MITVTDLAREIIDSGRFTYHVKASSWLGDTLLADVVPIVTGDEETDRSLAVPQRVILTVPRTVGITDWTPTSPTDPLAAAGQTVKVSLGVGTLEDVEWFQRGEFLILSTEEEGDSLRVTCASLLYLIDEAKFVAPFQPSGTIVSTLRSLLEPALPIDVTDAPADRAVPTSAVNWDSDRLGAVNELLDAWPAVARVHPQGYLVITTDVDPTVPVKTFTNGVGGTIVRAAGQSARDGGFNLVVATGYAADGGEVRGLAKVTSGPWAYGVGTANPLPVPFGYSSPLLTTNAQCEAGARTVLRRKMREAVQQAYDIECVPDPTIQEGDAVAVTTDLVTGLLCTVEALSLPYTASGPMAMRVVSVA